MFRPALAAALLLAVPACAAPVEVTRGEMLPLSAGGGTTIVLDGVQALGGPLPLYEVYLRSRGGKRALLGTLSFFNETAPDAPAVTSRRFDARAALAELGGPAVAVELVPASGVAGVAPRIAPGVRVVVARAHWADAQR